jgi:hypothetical protein
LFLRKSLSYQVQFFPNCKFNLSGFDIANVEQQCV